MDLIKKFFLLGLLVLSLVIPATFANAETPANTEKHVVYSANEITDENELLERALQSVTEDIDATTLSTLTVTDENGEEVNAEAHTISTTQKLSEIINEDGTTTESFVTTVFSESSLVPNSDIEITPFATGDVSKTTTDRYTAVRMVSRIYYDTQVVKGVTHFRMTRGTGSWQTIDASSNITYSNLKAVLSTSGYSSVCDDGYCSQGHTIPDKTSFDYRPNWKPIAKGREGTIAIVMTGTAREGSSSWAVNHTQNLLFDNIN